MNEVQKLGQKLAQLEENLATFQRAGVGLGRSSFDNGAISQYVNGQLGSIFGWQWDGSSGAYPVTGPTPPQPAKPEVEAVTGGLRIRWKGDWQAGGTTVAPMGFKHVEVHVGTNSGFSALFFDTLKTTITSARGGEVLVPLRSDREYWVKLVVRTDAGKVSAPSNVVGPYKPLKIREEDLGFEVSALAGTTVYYGTDNPVGAKFGDLWLQDTAAPGDAAGKYLAWRWTPGSPDAWKPVTQQAAAAAIAAAIAAATLASRGAEVFTQEDAPSWEGLDGSAIWVNPADSNKVSVWDGLGWIGRRLGSGAIKPHALVASDVIATGSITAALLESILVLTTTIIAGDPMRTHVKIKPDGVYVYVDDPSDGVPNEVIRMGTATNDFFGITDKDGMLILSLDDTGAVNARTANFREDIIVEGRSLRESLDEGARGLVGRWGGTITGLEPSGTTGIRETEYGIAQVSFPVVAGRAYKINWRLPFSYVTEAVGEVWQRLVYKIGGTPTPSDNRECGIVLYSGYTAGGWRVGDLPGYFEAYATGTATVMLVMRHQWPSSTSCLKVVENSWTEVQVYDEGKVTISAGGQTSGYGTLSGPPPPPPPPPTQQYYVDIGSDNRGRYRGNGTYRSDTSDVVQGWDPSGFNGDGYGWFGFAPGPVMPYITGTVDRVDLYLYWNHWYYNSGGTAIIAPIRAGDGAALNSLKLRPDWHVPGWPKPGGVWVTVPSDWWPYFRLHQCYGIGLGPSGTTNLTYYGRAADCRLRIWYTQ